MLTNPAFRMKYDSMTKVVRTVAEVGWVAKDWLAFQSYRVVSLSLTAV